MVPKLSIALCLAATLVGCGGGEPEVKETPASAQSASEAAATWTPEQKAAMEKALSERRNDDGPVAGNSGGK